MYVSGITLPVRERKEGEEWKIVRFIDIIAYQYPALLEKGQEKCNVNV